LLAMAVAMAFAWGWPSPSTVLWAAILSAAVGAYLLLPRARTRSLSTGELVMTSFSAGLSAIVGFFPPLFQVPWMMKVDLVAVPWVVCWTWIGAFPATLSALLSVPIVGFLEPFAAGGWVGGISKFLASVWTILVPAAVVRLGVDKEKLMNDNRKAALVSLAIALCRSVFMTAFNYYVAIPWYYGIDIENFIALLDKGLGLLKLVAPISGMSLFVLEMSFWNSIQAVIEFWASVLLYRALKGRLGKVG